MSKLQRFADKMFTTVAGAAASSLLVVKEHFDPQVTNMRRRRCRGNAKQGVPACEFYNPNRDQCTVCKCIIEIKSKSETNVNPLKGRVEITHCPKGKWDDQHIADLYTN